MRRASTVCAISSRKKQKVPRPSALARYSAMSAFFNSVSALTPGEVMRDADAGADLDQMVVDLVALAQAIDDAPRQAGGVFGGMMFCWNTTNSSPPNRATKSSGRSMSRSRSATAHSNWSPQG